MPSSFLKIGVLSLSLAVTFALTATVTGGAFARARFAQAQASPMFRVGMRLQGVVPEQGTGFPSLADDLRSIDATYGAPTGDVTQLVLLVREQKVAEAAALCNRLGWARCDAKALVEMRDMVGR